MANTVVQHGKNQSGGNTVSVTLNGVTAGNALIGGAISFSTYTSVAMADDKNGSWSIDKSVLNVINGIAIGHFANAAAGNTVITFTGNVGSVFNVFFAAEISAVPTSSETQGTPTSGNGNGTAADAGTINTTVTGIAFGLLSQGSSFTMTPGSGWTLIEEETSFANQNGSLIYKTGAAGAYNPTWTISGSSTWNAVTMALKELIAASGKPTAYYAQQRNQ